VPMMTGGDEMLRSQRCNNNPYNLDSIATWIDWSSLDDPTSPAATFATFARRMIAFRRAHPSLRPADWHDSTTISWVGPDGSAPTAAYLDDPGNHFIGWRLHAIAGETVRSIYVAYNGASAPIAITLPPKASDAQWLRVADTAAWMEDDANMHEPGDEYTMMGTRYDLAARSLVLFIEE